MKTSALASAVLLAIAAAPAARGMPITEPASALESSSITPLCSVPDAYGLEKRYVQGFAAPSGYYYSWVIDGYRLALDTQGIKSYITRSTISKDASATTQTHVNQCVALCEKQVGCAMASIIRFNKFPEGNVICALYNATAPKSEAKYTTGMWNGPGTVSASYTFTRNAGQVKALTTTTTRASTSTTTSSTRSSTSTTSSRTTSSTSSSTTSSTTVSSTSTFSSSTSSSTPAPTTTSTAVSSSSVVTTLSTSTTTGSTTATSDPASSSVATSTSTSSSTTSSATASATATAAKVYDAWQFIDVPGTTCADGSQTGFALNLHSSTDLVIGFQEGGSCYDYNTCYVQKKAYNIVGGYSNSTFWGQSQPSKLNGWFPFARSNQWNPWQTANYAWIPYCTGDYHSGDNSVLYDGSSVVTNHRGWRNSKLDLAKIRELVPNVQRVWIMGSSAGGFASILQYQNAQDSFPGVRVDLFADSGISPNPITRRPSQNVQVPDKSRCPNCNDASFDSYIVGLAQANPGSRFASMSWANDTTIPVNQGISFDAFSAEITGLFNEQNGQTSNARNFKVPGSGHTLMYNTQYNAADGYTQATFLNKFKTDDPGWGSH